MLNMQIRCRHYNKINFKVQKFERSSILTQGTELPTPRPV